MPTPIVLSLLLGVALGGCFAVEQSHSWRVAPLQQSAGSLHVDFGISENIIDYQGAWQAEWLVERFDVQGPNHRPSKALALRLSGDEGALNLLFDAETGEFLATQHMVGEERWSVYPNPGNVWHVEAGLAWLPLFLIGTEWREDQARVITLMGHSFGVVSPAAGTLYATYEVCFGDACTTKRMIYRGLEASPIPESVKLSYLDGSASTQVLQTDFPDSGGAVLITTGGGPTAHSVIGERQERGNLAPEGSVPPYPFGLHQAVDAATQKDADFRQWTLDHPRFMLEQAHLEWAGARWMEASAKTGMAWNLDLRANTSIVHLVINLDRLAMETQGQLGSVMVSFNSRSVGNPDMGSQWGILAERDVIPVDQFYEACRLHHDMAEMWISARDLLSPADITISGDTGGIATMYYVCQHPGGEYGIDAHTGLLAHVVEPDPTPAAPL